MSRRIFPACLLVVGLANLSQPLLVQAEDLALEEVVVTARKREESLQAVPVAVSAFTPETMESLGIRNMRDSQAKKTMP